MKRVKDIFTEFNMESMYSADERSRFRRLVNDYHEVVTVAGTDATPFDKMLAGYGIDKYEEYSNTIVDSWSS